MSDIDLGGVPLVSLRGIVKRFGDFTANDHIDLDIRNGEVHALLGENGAGKSTLVKILYGLLEPSEGRIVFAGDDVVLKSPEQARALGIGMVFQHFSLFENLTVAENIALVLPRTDKLTALPNRIAEIAARYGMALEADRPVWTLSAGERQRIEIARCLLQDPKLLILDEPTSVLTPQEAGALFATLDRLKAEGRALLYISHRLEEVKRLCDCATILRHGKVVATCDPKVESARSLAALMVGSQVKEVKHAGAN
ncbi:MAG: ATP-binding cassette domain-containing protein, partial [Methylobacteriaceae bacterium]|nr:ATP-binding cassette domain-containing protein [Methylobacteriaceae bacterium]